MRTASPWWLSLVFGAGLFLVFIGERMFGHEGGARGVLTMLGIVLILGVTAVRAYTMVGTTGARQRVERTLLLCHVATIVALVLYALTTNWGVEKLSLSEAGATKFTTALTVIWAILLFASTIPVLMIELSLGQALRTSFDVGPRDGDEAGVEYFRVRDIGWSGLSIALASGFLMMTCQVANKRNVQRDLSYFKTSAPGDSTKSIVRSSPDPIRVLLFFPQTNEVKEQVKSYFEALASAVPGKVTLEVHDRFLDAELAAKYKVTTDGLIVFIRGTGDKEKSDSVAVDTEIDKARKGSSKLRNFDREVNSLLMKVMRDKRKAYLMTGHGEMNDPDSIPPDMKARIGQERRSTVLKKRLGELNYEVKELGLIDMASNVPDDATVVIMMAPTLELQPAEWASLDRYLAKGGRLLIALDPKAQQGLGELEGKLGLKFNPGDLTDDKAFLPQRGSPADRRFVITTQFSAHASTTALSRSVDKGMIVIDSGALEDAPIAAGVAAPTKTITIRSMESSWLDLNNDFNFDPATEKRQRWNLAAAVEGPKLKDKDGFRALVFADVDLFADVFVSNGMGRAAPVLISGPLLDDAIRWLGGEEVFSGEVISEDDKPIKHTKNQDAKWFTLTIVGGPLLVLTLGLVGTWFRRRRPKTEVKP